ncbi:hypothetical protein GCM10022221_73840 [Actinocorallia aurea]
MSFGLFAALSPGAFSFAAGVRVFRMVQEGSTGPGTLFALAALAVLALAALAVPPTLVLARSLWGRVILPYAAAWAAAYGFGVLLLRIARDALTASS